jgi:ABC-2 type transport system permease protein
MRSELHAEWTKLRTFPGNGWLLLLTVVLTVGLSAGAAGAVTCSASCHQDPARISLTGIVLGQAVIATLAVQMLGGEYDTGMIRSSLAAMPRRIDVLAAKATTLSGAVLMAGIPAVLGSLLVGRVILPSQGFRGPLLSLTTGPVLRATAGSAVYLVLIGLLGLGVAALVRESASAVGLVLALLFLFPIVTQTVTDPDWQRRLHQISPMDAGLAIQNTQNLHGLPIGPWAGLGVLALWAAGALVAGGVMLQLRDA